MFEAKRTEFDVACATVPAPLGRAERMARGRQDVSEAFHRLFLAMIPRRGEHCGGGRLHQAGYHRMCALAWRVGPDEFWPGMTGEQVAKAIGISYQAFKKHLCLVDEYLRNGRAEL